MASMIVKASSKIVRSASPIGPAGERTARWHPPSSNDAIATHGERTSQTVRGVRKPVLQADVTEIGRDLKHGEVAARFKVISDALIALL